MKSRLMLMFSCLGLVLVGCTSMAVLPKQPVNPCDLTPPKIEWYQTTDGGIYYTKEGAAELLNYIYDLKDCVEQR